jgi:NAD(P)-dependent dehydrogenase (short-subunit alcohol dehydrogenase family)
MSSGDNLGTILVTGACGHIGHEVCRHLREARGEILGSYVSESDFFEKDWQHSYWGSNYARLASVKKKYDPTGLFFVHNGVGSEEWSGDGFSKL